MVQANSPLRKRYDGQSVTRPQLVGLITCKVLSPLIRFSLIISLIIVLISCICHNAHPVADSLLWIVLTQVVRDASALNVMGWIV